MHVELYHIGSEIFVAASLSEGRIAWANYWKQRLVRVVDLPEGIYDAFDVSSDGYLLVTGYWYTRGLDVWNLASGERIDHFGPARVNRVRVDPTGRFVVASAGRNAFVHDLTDGTHRPLAGCGDVQGSCCLHREQVMLIPTSRKAHLYSLHWLTGELELVEMPGYDEMWAFCCSPREDALVLLEANGRVSCRDGFGGGLLWQQQFEDREGSSLATWSADGRWLALSANVAGRTIVLEARSGEVSHYLEEPIGGPCPLVGSKVMEGEGRIRDLTDGSLEPGVSSWRWWRAAGLKSVDE